MAGTFLGGRFVASRRRAVLAVGDLLALLVFAAASAARHGGSTGVVAQTALQFGLGWVAVAVATGAYGERALAGRTRAAALGAGTWAGGAVVGALLRYATEPGAGLSAVFVLVTAGVGAVIFGVWRAIAAGRL